MQIAVVEKLEELESYAEAWNGLALQAPQKLPMLSHAWMATFLECCLPRDFEWFCLFALENGKVLGVLPIVVKRGNTFGRGSKVLRPPSDWHTISTDFIVTNERESDVTSALLAALPEIVPGWRRLEIAHIPETSPTAAIAGKGLRGYRFLNEYHGRFSFININGSYEDFFKHLSSNFRKQLRKTDKKLLALPDVSTSFLTDGPFDSALDSFLMLEASGWKGKAGSAILSSPELTRFYHRLVQRLAELGWVEFHFLHSGDTAIAGQLAIRMGPSLIVFKIAYNEEYAVCSPGNQLFRRCIEREFALGKGTRINCLADTAWHRTWRMKTRDFYNVHIYPSGRAANLLRIPARRTWIRLRKSPLLLRWKRALFREATTHRS